MYVYNYACLNIVVITIIPCMYLKCSVCMLWTIILCIFIQLVGTLVVFNGTVLFENNRHHSEGLSGALYLSSFGQMLLAENARLNFIGNIGRFVTFTIFHLHILWMCFMS